MCFKFSLLNINFCCYEISCTPLILNTKINFLNPYVLLPILDCVSLFVLFFKYAYDFCDALYCLMNFYGPFKASDFLARFVFKLSLLFILF